MKSHHKRLRYGGYYVSRVVNDEDLAERLPVVMDNLRQGVYSSVRILPADVALQEEEISGIPDYHLVYVKYNSENSQARGEKLATKLVEIQNIHGKIFPLNLGNLENLD